MSRQVLYIHSPGLYTSDIELNTYNHVLARQQCMLARQQSDYKVNLCSALHFDHIHVTVYMYTYSLVSMFVFVMQARDR